MYANPERAVAMPEPQAAGLQSVTLQVTPLAFKMQSTLSGALRVILCALFDVVGCPVGHLDIARLRKQSR